MRRRDFIRGGVLTTGALALGPAFWRAALAGDPPARAGAGPYGPLGPPDANGIAVPKDFRVRVVARGNQPVADTGYVLPPFPDGQATFPTDDGGFILVANSEAPAAVGGGASAIRFDPQGRITDAYRILGGTNNNCAGGGTPWGTWMSCEEIDAGRVWECDPFGKKPAVVHPAMGVFSHEAVAVDPEGKRIYLTEDKSDSAFYRFTPDRYPDASSGRLEVAKVDGEAVTWVAVPDPSGASAPTRAQVPGIARFKRGEGIWFDSGIVYVVTTSDDRVYAYNTVTETIEVLYDGEALADAPLTSPDNVTVSRSGDLFVGEDPGGDDGIDIVVVTPEREAAVFTRLTGPQHMESEATGPIFDPAGTRFLFSSQRAVGGSGAIYEVTGPFRLARPPDLRSPAIRLEAPEMTATDSLPLSVLVDGPATVTVALRARLVNRSDARRRRDPTRNFRYTLAKTRQTVEKAGRVDLRLKLTAAARRRLRGRRTVNAEIDVRATDAAGNTRFTTQPVTLRRPAARRR